MGWACDWEGIYAYRERIAISDGTLRCCESGILIPAGFPYADCRPGWWDESTDFPKAFYNESGDAIEEPDMLPTSELLPHLNPHPQCIEVWRLIRNDSSKRGACPSWGNAAEEYHDAALDEYEWSDRLASIKLNATISRTSRRYKEGKRPRLHPHEQASIESGDFQRSLPYSYRRPKEKVAA